MMTKIRIQRHSLVLMSIAMILLLTVSLASCVFDESENNYRGGELVDDEKMSEIKNELLGAENDTQNDPDTSIKPDADKDDEGTQRDTEGTERNETERSDSEADTAIIVYWTASGSVWHLSRDCYHIKNKEVNSGTILEAEEAGHKSGCKTCNKNGS